MTDAPPTRARSRHPSRPETGAARPGEDRGPGVIPGETWRMLATRSRRTRALPRGLDAAWHAASGRVGGLVPRTRRYVREAEQVVATRPRYAGLSDAKLREAARGLREPFRRGRETDDDLHELFAIVCEAARRSTGLDPYPEQVAAALAMHAGCVAEMATGEGKTLAATMPAVAAGFRGRGCHVITVNDYLAARDDREMGPIYALCGVSVAHVDQDMGPDDRRRAYGADVTYCTNKEVTADFLRDRLSLGRVRSLSSALLERIIGGAGAGTDRLVMRGLATAIIDEADSILVDEAVTPLIISGGEPNEEEIDVYRRASSLAAGLELGRDFSLDQRYREVNLTGAGRARLDDLTGDLGGVWSGRRRREEFVRQALNARELYRPGKQYVVQDDKIVIVDEFTGRLMPDRTWRDGLHQAVEAKEGLTVNTPKETLARVSFQRFFRLYDHLAGMTGTAWEARHELWQIYALPVVVLPTHRPCCRTYEPDRIFADGRAKWRAVVEEIRRVHDRGRPILVGTRSVQASEHLSGLLRDMGLAHQVLNAVRHAEEAAVVAQAGHAGYVTVATNMAGRGTDIKLAPGVAESGGLHVIATERHESARIDRQLAGRCARQGDPGSATAFVSLDDELFKRYAPRTAGPIVKRHTAGAGPEPITSATVQRLYGMAQARSDRLALARRKSVLRNDDWLDEFLGFAGRDRDTGG